MTLRLAECKLIFKSYADCLGMFLALAKQNETHTYTLCLSHAHTHPKKLCHVAHMVFDPRGSSHM